MDLNVTGLSAAVVGGDIRAAAHVAALLEGGAVVTVIAPDVTATIDDLAARGLVTWTPRDPGPGELDAFDLVLRGHPRAAETDRILDTGSVTLVGGGPGDPGLVTVAGRAAIERADVIVTDRLAPLAALGWARADVEVVDVAKIPGGRSTSQDDINQLLVEHAKAGRHVVRFKGGDNFVFGRGGEELLACHEAGIATHVVPGVSSAIAAPALAGIPVTHRGLTQGFTVVSGHVPPGHPDSTLDYAALARAGTSIVVLMGVRTLEAICAALVDGGLDPATPAAVVADGSLPSQHVVRATVATIAGAAADVRPPAVAVIGDVADVEGLA
ncbi:MULTISPECIES: uroporphyrinogen-III C-methyltransferase [Aeromicrobium]|uniref:uroporphyrinogen-III C-methyltransferase n=1 Tax=Aeromicrobium TaxID=2040 RepID=UPI0006FC5872|nr:MULTISPECIES: uroporphyrinogen-III C-methyltransferase [Aeromicrobium]KQX74576.1 uroporphyrinogen-III C-methyltransferase [Aeromicrobium sp. Root472D3]MCL8252946.1 uroporphyrinogen-III C-methyltransferase [Aeromicrobium fastidiosum]